MIDCWIDGACEPNPGQMGIGVVIKRDGKAIKKLSENMGYGTNNQAEFHALLRCIKELLKNNMYNAIIRSDSSLVVNTMNKGWKLKSQGIRDIKQKIDQLIDENTNLYTQPTYTLKWIRRERNAIADRLSLRCLKNKSVYRRKQLKNCSFTL